MTEQQIFQLLGIVYSAIGLGTVFNHKYYRKVVEDYIHNPPFVYLNGTLALLIGYLFATYELPRTDYTWIIRTLGWLAVVKGVLIIVTPKQYISMTKMFRVNSLLSFEILFVLILGAVMLYLGFK